MFKPLTRNMFLNNTLHASDLINHVNRVWRMDVLEALFLPRD